ncbi:MAG TPA: DNA-directed RNA polymerase subunit alpha C-terminal domain-containing protein [Gemmatales bacterium]|mgnify:CR=1 FL=1|nr:DNA-directed RNA polymerase subunit alpha C-terminal domain-containing protein [Gemmatales bacterium]HMP60392.1 DNA-directed RNA polymerase subunit alpha C-terminal domain-containing protein [Gemmatales bacterium]
MEAIKTDIKALFLEKEDCDAGTVQRLRDGLRQGAGQYKALREVVETMRQRVEVASGAVVKKWQLKLGVANYFLGRLRDAAEFLRQAETPLAHFYLGRALASLSDLDDAHKAFEKAEKMGYTASQVQLQRAGLYRAQRHLKQAHDLLHKLEELSSHSAEYHFQLGYLRLEEGDRLAAIKHFEKAIEMDPHHVGALFQLGCANDLNGNDEEAINLYERCVAQHPVHVGPLLNLGILYEDHNRYDDAVRCFQLIVDADPTNERARLFFKDAYAAQSMFIDEDAERRYDRFSQVLEIPVTDFELSVRSRNCLKKMNIRTLGDLTRVTEAQLLASKNFGETSLLEIKEMLEDKGLRLGQALEEGARYDPRFRAQQPALSEQEQAVLSKPVSELNLSVRARKCMNRLGISTLGELCSRTADELLEVKNFGQTSLLEVRDKLRTLQIKLRGD